jgi:hypothetical protein
LLGNVVWAAACFATGGTAFAISVVGIGIGALPAIPEKSKSFIPDVQKLMEDYIDGIFDQLDHSLRNKAKALLKQYPDITRFHALNEFMTASFQPSYFKLNKRYTTIPVLSKAAIRDLYEREATEKLDEAIKAEEAEKERIRREALKGDWLPKGGPGRF